MAPSDLLEFAEEEIVKDFLVCFLPTFVRSLLPEPDNEHRALHHSEMGGTSPPSPERCTNIFGHKQLAMGRAVPHVLLAISREGVAAESSPKSA